MRILIFGKAGQLGHALNGEFASRADEHTVVAHGRGETDLASASGITSSLEAFKPDLIINAAAYTAVDRAEEEPELARQVNANAVACMGAYAKQHHVALIHVSTDYVFDGSGVEPYREDDPTGPLNVYGQSKLDGERLLSESSAPALVLRTAWVYSLQRPSFVKTMLGLAKKHPRLEVVSDQIGSPTWSVALARGIVQLVDALGPDPHARVCETRGVYHLAGGGVTSRQTLVEAMIQIGADAHDLITTEVAPVTSDRFPTPARRPLYSALNCDLISERFGISLPPWKESLAEALATREP